MPRANPWRKSPHRSPRSTPSDGCASRATVGAGRSAIRCQLGRRLAAAGVAAARAMAGAARDGFSIATPAANATAFAACPDGKDGLAGRGSRRAAGTFTSGRWRTDRPLPTLLAVTLAAARLSRPRHAARRAHRSPVTHPAAHRAPASTIHRKPRLASRDTVGMTRSSVRESVTAIRWAATRTASPWGWPRTSSGRVVSRLRRGPAGAPAGVSRGLPTWWMWPSAQAGSLALGTRCDRAGRRAITRAARPRYPTVSATGGQPWHRSRSAEPGTTRRS